MPVAVLALLLPAALTAALPVCPESVDAQRPEAGPRAEAGPCAETRPRAEMGPRAEAQPPCGVAAPEMPDSDSLQRSARRSVYDFRS